MSITRAEAKAKGLKRYYTGKYCKRGHLSERYVGKGTCIECLRAARKRWEKSEDGVKRKRASRLRWYYKNREYAKEKNKEWMLKNAEWFKPIKNARQNAAYRERMRGDPEYVENRRRTNKNWRMEHREQERVRSRRYKLEGPQNPKGEGQWLKKSRALLRKVKRYLRNPQHHHEASH